MGIRLVNSIPLLVPTARTMRDHLSAELRCEHQRELAVRPSCQRYRFISPARRMYQRIHKCQRPGISIAAKSVQAMRETAPDPRRLCPKKVNIEEIRKPVILMPCWLRERSSELERLNTCRSQQRRTTPMQQCRAALAIQGHIVQNAPY